MSRCHRIAGVLALVLALASVASGLASAGQRQDPTAYPPLTPDQFPGLSVRHVAGDMGPAPKFNAADYADYDASKTGPANWCGTVVLRRKDGELYPLTEIDIIPRTPYTIWYINTWLAAINGRQTARMFSEPDWMPAIRPLPWATMLTETIPPNSSAQIVRSALADQRGNFCIHDIPAGEYIYFGSAKQTFVVTNTSWINDPDNLDLDHPTMKEIRSDSFRTLGNWYVVCGGVRLTGGTWILERPDVCATTWDDN